MYVFRATYEIKIYMLIYVYTFILRMCVHIDIRKIIIAILYGYESLFLSIAEEYKLTVLTRRQASGLTLLTSVVQR